MVEGYNHLLMMLVWLAELTFSSWLLSYGAEHLSFKYGAKFVGRTLLSIATTLPEIAIVVYAAMRGSYGVAIGSGLGSNLLMMTLGLSVMLLIATTRLSKFPLKSIDISAFKMDKIFLIITAIVSAVVFIDGYNYADGIIFTGMFAVYIGIAFFEMIRSKSQNNLVKTGSNESKSVDISSKEPGTNIPNDTAFRPVAISGNKMVKAIIAFLLGTIGIVIGAEPFIEALEGFSVDIQISAIVLAVIISPIAGEMPEKISLMLLARKGAHGASIAIANVLGSKILNNTLLLAVAVFGAMIHGGFYSSIEPTPLLLQQIVLVTIVTLLSVGLISRKTIGLRTGIILASMYVVSIGIQFVLIH
jgi:cation:H+ antiporter